MAISTDTENGARLSDRGRESSEVVSPTAAHTSGMGRPSEDKTKRKIGGERSPEREHERHDVGTSAAANHDRDYDFALKYILTEHPRSQEIFEATQQRDPAQFEAAVTRLGDQCALEKELPAPKGWTLLQMAMLVGKADIVRKLAEAGADLNYRSTTNGCTALAFCVSPPARNSVRPPSSALDTLVDAALQIDLRENLVALLLGLGANPDVEFDGKKLDEFDAATHGMKYNFERARLPAVRKWFDVDAEKRMKKMAALIKLPNLPNIRELPFSLIGQSWAVTTLNTAIRDWAFQLPSNPGGACLALVFAGPSGHGKTELAKKLSEVLCRSPDDFHKVDCASLRTASEIFGMGGAYQGAKQGSSLNNWMKAHDDKIGVVIFDELEKAEHDVRTQLLNILDKGEFQDKQLTSSSQSKRVNCRKIVWIFTTNAFDPLIMEETKDWQVHSGSAKIMDRSKRALENRLRKKMQQTFEVCFAGRINRLVTFVPFCAPDKPSDCILDDETRVLLDAGVSRDFAWFQDKKRNHHDDIPVDFARPEDRQDFLDLLRENYHRDEGARCVNRLLEQFLRGPVIGKWHLDKMQTAKQKAEIRVNATEAEVEIDIIPNDCDS
ncbi:unnamed protein product [Amoebophrya sp. A120]|nr:unnamed protein product [Amoebophrya sp. A120]|eukprot:GSA120T00003123001.1